jgi:YVTN family beta-propeller protein
MRDSCKPLALLLGLSVLLSACDNNSNNNTSSSSSSSGAASSSGATGGSSSGSGSSSGTSSGAATSSVLPNGDTITPTAAPGAIFTALNPNLTAYPSYTLGQAMTETISPDGKTLLILTSGYNDISDPTGQNTVESNEFVFVYNISSGAAQQVTALPVPNTFAGIAWGPDSQHFYVGGGADDDVHLFALSSGSWAEASNSPIKLNHQAAATDSVFGTGNGIEQGAVTTGVAVTADGKHLVIDNYYNDSISVVDLVAGSKVADLDLRPGKSGGVSGTPGGEAPFWVSIVGSTTAYVSSLRDREIDVVDLTNPAAPAIKTRIPVQGSPNKMTLNSAQTLLYVAMDNADAVAVIDTTKNAVVNSIPTIAPPGPLSQGGHRYRGAAPNDVALSPDGGTLYVSNGGTNSVAVIALNGEGTPVTGLIPTGWYPQAVAVGQAGGELYVVNSRSLPGPNTGNCFGYNSPCLPDSPVKYAANEYILQLEKAGFLQVPVPNATELTNLTAQVYANNGFSSSPSPNDFATMAALHQNIKHVIYIVRENRTYDQILGDLSKGNGDPGLTEFPAKTTPNIHALANTFVTFDNFYDPAEVSGDGWQWSMASREADANVKDIPIDYAYPSRGVAYDSEGTNRNVNVGIASQAARLAADPATPTDPDLLPGNNSDDTVDGPDGEVQQGYLWNAAVRAGLTVRNYGYYCDLTRYSTSLLKSPTTAPLYVPLDTSPFKDNVVQAYPADPVLLTNTDQYFRGFDNNYPDYYREQEWQREFSNYVTNNNLPALSLVRFMHDHTSGNVSGAPFGSAIAGVNTPETQVADNDYAVGLLLQTVANSPYANNTLIFIIEDDAQDGADHVDAHRSVAFIAGPYVKKGALVSDHYSTVNILRTIEDVLGLDHMSVFDAYQPPMTDAFDLSQTSWTFTAQVPAILSSTSLPVTSAVASAQPRVKPLHDAKWWARETRGMDFSAPDKVNAAAYNQILWKGIMGNKPYPKTRSGKDLRNNREELLKKYGIDNGLAMAGAP